MLDNETGAKLGFTLVFIVFVTALFAQRQQIVDRDEWVGRQYPGAVWKHDGYVFEKKIEILNIPKEEKHE